MRTEGSHSISTPTICEHCGEAILGTWNAQIQHGLEHSHDTESK